MSASLQAARANVAIAQGVNFFVWWKHRDGTWTRCPAAFARPSEASSMILARLSAGDRESPANLRTIVDAECLPEGDHPDTHTPTAAIEVSHG